MTPYGNKKPPHRRGVCPGLSAPMQTGDGLLVRLTPIATIPPAAFAGLCAAARQCGNGVVEITSRGSIQARGLTAASAETFAAAVDALDIAVPEGVAIAINPLTGLDKTEILDAGELAADLRGALEARRLAAKLSAKVSVVIDGGGALTLDAVPADVRLCADPSGLRVGVAGDAADAVELGRVATRDSVAAALRLLEILAARGRAARAREVLAAEGRAVFQNTIADLLIGAAGPRPARRSADAIGAFPLRDGSWACGVGLAFGHADAAVLEQLVEAAQSAGAQGFRPAPGRALLAIGLTRAASILVAAIAAKLGFVVRSDDPRRRVVACAGAPICGSAHIPARQMAPLLADELAAQLGGSATLHVSGCAKGCAHPAPATLTVVGTPDGCALVEGGSARDAASAVVPADEVATRAAKILRATRTEAAHV
jgi:precorrin-3B synthase